MLRKFSQSLLSRYERELTNLQQRISSGVCVDYAAYREMAGRCSQLRSMIDATKEELEKFIEGDEE